MKRRRGIESVCVGIGMRGEGKRERGSDERGGGRIEGNGRKRVGKRKSGGGGEWGMFLLFYMLQSQIEIE